MYHSTLRFIWRWVVCGLVGVGAHPLAAATTQEPDGRREAAAIKMHVDQAVTPLIDGRKNLGIMVGVLAGPREHVYGYGRVSLDQDRLPDGKTMFEIASVTKVFTAALLAQMVLTGQVALDEPVQKYLPAGLSMPHDPNHRPITLADLATHHSGLPRLPTNFAPANWSNPYADYTENDLYAFLSSYKPTRPAGERYEYSNVGAALLGHVLARAAGDSYENLVRRRICEPLGMDDTCIALSQQQRQRLAQPTRTEKVGDVQSLKAGHNWDLTTFAGCGGLRSNLHDMLIFARANLGQAPTPLTAALKMAHQQRYAVNDTLGIGLGWHIHHLPGVDEPILWHNGQTGGYHSFIGLARAHRAAVVVLTNTAHSIDNEALAILKALVTHHAAEPTLGIQRWKTENHEIPRLAVGPGKRAISKQARTSGAPGRSN